MKALFFFLTIFLSLYAGANEGTRIIACKVEPLLLPNNRVQVGFYKSVDPGKKSVLIIPPTGGENVLDRSYASNLCEGGFDVYLLQHWNNDDDNSIDLGIHQRAYDSVQQAIAETLSQIQSPFIGILGTSVGAIHVSSAMSLHPRLDAAFLIVGGAPIANVIATTDQEALVKARKIRFEMLHYKNDAEYIAALDKEIHTDPFKLPQGFRGKTLGMVISSDDTTVNYKYQLQLKELWQPQTLIELSNGHFFAILKTWLFHKMEIVHFFQNAAQVPKS
ncbi:MAG: hypothetical protein H7326_06560 [Bdellovibrionaceae bacterium]|nr:hypothetical protein [Pseudobdellovibrionaceae bacterium]